MEKCVRFEAVEKLGHQFPVTLFVDVAACILAPQCQ